MRKILLGCGILGSLLYLAMNVAVPRRWPGYSVASQTVSELSAIGAPTRRLWSALAIPYGVLMVAFAVGVLLSVPPRSPLRVAGILMLVGALVGFAWPPMHLRPVLAAGGGTLSDTLHIVFAGVWGLLALTELACGATALGKGFRLYSIVTLVVVITFGVLTGLNASGVGADRPTPWIGVWERIQIGAYVLWVVVLAIALLPAGGDPVNPASVASGPRRARRAPPAGAAARTE